MTNLIKIAVDAMGGDGSPKKIIDGIIYNHKQNKENFFRIFGKKNIIEDKKSGEYRLSHHLDLKTGMYKGRQVLDPKE